MFNPSLSVTEAAAASLLDGWLACSCGNDWWMALGWDVVLTPGPPSRVWFACTDCGVVRSSHVNVLTQRAAGAPYRFRVAR
jgi:hypothetical protein